MSSQEAKNKLVETQLKLLMEQWRKHLREQQQPRVILYTDPNWYGADFSEYSGDKYPTEGKQSIILPLNKLEGFEPDKKMESSESAPKVEKIKNDVLEGEKMPPILVRKYGNGWQVIDGHHRFHGIKRAGEENKKIVGIEVIIVPANEIEERDKAPEDKK